MYPTVRKWLEKKELKTANQKEVLRGWVDTLGERLGKKFHVDRFDEMIYQMVHRAASAAFAGENPRMAYFVFEPLPNGDPAKTKSILLQLTSLWNLLGKPTNFPFYLVKIKTKRLDAFDLVKDFKKGREETSEAVCAALQGKAPLFSFKKGEICKVGEATT